MSRFDSEPQTGEQDGYDSVYRVEYTKDPAESLKVIFNGEVGGDQVLDCTSWLYMDSELAIAFAHGYARSNLRNRSTTRHSNYTNMEIGFVRWLIQHPDLKKIGFEDLTVKLFDRFDLWLSEKDEFGEYLLSQSTSLHWRGTVKAVVESLKESDEYRGRLERDCRLRVKPYVGLERSSKATEPFDLPTFGKILVAIRTDIKKSLTILKERKRLFAEGRRLINAVGGQGKNVFILERQYKLSDQRSLALLLAQLEKEFGPVLPPLSEIRKISEDIYDRIQERQAGVIYPYFHPSGYEIMPFLYQMCVFTAFNPSTLLSLQLGSGVKVVKALGTDRIVFTAWKARKKNYVSQSYIATDEEIGPANLILALKEWTKEIRAVAPSEIADDVFLFVPSRNAVDRNVRSFRLLGLRGVNFDLNNAVTAFHKRHNLPRISLQRVRATVAFLANDLFGGDVRAVMDFLQHSGTETTLRNYTSGAAKARHAEIIATTQQLRERWLLTNGRLDPKVLAETGDPGAATPGWQCADPYNSPIAGQRVGKLCDAYGSCPVCPLAKVAVNSAVALARIRQVRIGLERAKFEVLPERWAHGLAPIHRAVADFWEQAFSEDIKRQASLVHTSPIPDFS